MFKVPSKLPADAVVPGLFMWLEGTHRKITLLTLDKSSFCQVFPNQLKGSWDDDDPFDAGNQYFYLPKEYAI